MKLVCFLNCNSAGSVRQVKSYCPSYGDIQIDAGYRIDLLVEEAVIVELKAVETVLPIHQAQLLSYLKLSGKKLGLLLNFNSTLMKHGIIRIVNNI